MSCLVPIGATVYNGRDNAIALAVESSDGGVMTSLAGLTRVTVTIGATTLDSATAGSSVIWWTDTATYRSATIDVLKLRLGGQSLTAGEYADCALVIYDATHTNGLRIDTPLKLEVVA